MTYCSVLLSRKEVIDACIFCFVLFFSLMASSFKHRQNQSLGHRHLCFLEKGVMHADFLYNFVVVSHWN